MTNESRLSLDDFEMITTITQVYEDDIYNYALQSDSEYNQEFIAKVVRYLFNQYKTLTDNRSMLDMIEDKEIKLYVSNNMDNIVLLENVEYNEITRSLGNEKSMELFNQLSDTDAYNHYREEYVPNKNGLYDIVARKLSI